MVSVMFGVLQRIRSRIRGASASQRGAVSVVLAMSVIPLVALVGIAIDAGRGYMVKSQLGQAVDAAALAGGRAMYQTFQASDIQKYFDANFPPEFMDAEVDPLQVNVSEAGNTVEVVATAHVPTSFLQVVAVSDVTVSARALVHREIRGLELALVMDNTGSMRSGGKMDAMKSAATDLIDAIYGSRETVPDLYVSLVPYTAMVNIGAGRQSWLTGFNSAIYGSTTWKGCVEARIGNVADPNDDYDDTDDPPSVALWSAAFWPSTEGVYPSAGDNDWNNGNIDETNMAQNDGLGPNLGCGPAITPLIAPKTDVLAAINEMLPWHRGGTMANLGLVWGWRTLSPQWRGLWGGNTPAELPLNYGEALMDKAVVLLTDGENQWYDWPGGLPGKPDLTTFPGADYTAYGRINEERLGPGIDTNGEAKTEINTRMAALCTAMKAEGIIMYTVLFKVNDSDTETLYQNCATSPAHAFDADSNAALASAFQTIGVELANLRLAE